MTQEGGAVFSKTPPRRRKPRDAPEAPEAPLAVEPEPAPVVEPVAVGPVAAEPESALVDAVVVRLGGSRYALPMDDIAEVGRMPRLTRVPGMPSWVAGVANWRGRVLAMLDVRPLLGAPTVGFTAGARAVVLSRDGVVVALLTEGVEGVVPLDAERLEPPLPTLSTSAASLVSGHITTDAAPVAVLDLDTIFGLRSQLPRARRAG